MSSDQILLLKLINDLKLTLVQQCKYAVGLIDVGYNVYSYTNDPVAGNFFTKFELNNFFTKVSFTN